jgi:TPR repeat protein
MFNVGVCYEHGLGVERNLPLARKWYCGLPKGVFLLG